MNEVNECSIEWALLQWWGSLSKFFIKFHKKMQKKWKISQKTWFFSKIDSPRGASKYTVIRAGKPVKRYGRRTTKGRFLTQNRVFWGSDPPQMADVRFCPIFRIFSHFFAFFCDFFHFFINFLWSYTMNKLYAIYGQIYRSFAIISLLLINIANTQTSFFFVFQGSQRQGPKKMSPLGGLDSEERDL